MTRLEELLSRWEDQSITADEIAELKEHLRTAHGRVKLVEEFLTVSALIGAFQAEDVRTMPLETSASSANSPADNLSPLPPLNQVEMSHGSWKTFFHSAGFGGRNSGSNRSPNSPPRRRMIVRGVAAVAVAALVIALGGPFFRDHHPYISGCSRTGLKIDRGGTSVPVTPNLELRPGDILETSDHGVATIRYHLETTRIEMGPNTTMKLMSAGPRKHFGCSNGQFHVTAAPQRKGCPMIFTTPQVEVKVLGTKFVLASSSEQTRLEVIGGHVQITRRDNQAQAFVSDNQIVVADAASSELLVEQKRVTTERFKTEPLWDSTFDAPWGGAAAWLLSDDTSRGKVLGAVRTTKGSSARVKVFQLTPNASYTLSICMKCAESNRPYWAETAFKLGDFSAEDFDQHAASWTMVQKFSDTSVNGNSDHWHRYTVTLNTGPHTEVSVGFKLGLLTGRAGLAVRWDDLSIQ